MSFIGVQFDKMRVTPAYDAMALQSIVGTSAIKDWGGVPAIGTGLTVTIPPSAYIICGRYIRITSLETVNVPANFTGSIVITIDLTKTNDSSGNPVYDNYSVTNNQIYFRAIATSNIRIEDVNNLGKVYDLELAKVTTSASAVTSLDNSTTRIMNTPQPSQFRAMAISLQRTYRKQAAFDVTIPNKLRQLAVVLQRTGTLVTAEISFKSVTTLSWQTIVDLNGFPGYRPANAMATGVLNEDTYNTEPGGVYVSGTNLAIMHVGRTDVQECAYHGTIIFATNDDYPNEADVTNGFKRL